MTKLVRSYNFTKDINDDVIGCVFDWFEVRVKATPLITELQKLGYNEENDKGCATHKHYFENDDFSVSWDIRHVYVEKFWSHFRVKNHVFYTLKGYSTLVFYVISTCKRLFDCSEDDVIISRIDFAFDMPTGSSWHNALLSRFENRSLGCEKYTKFSGKVGSRQYVNYSAGSRSAQIFMRLYYKTIENTSYREHMPKKQYIKDWHEQLFGVDCDVVRFEVEYKPKGNTILTELVYRDFKDLWEKYACACDVNLLLGEGYTSNEKIFTERDKVQLIKLLRKFLSSPWDNNLSFASYSLIIDEFRDIIENIFNERL